MGTSVENLDDVRRGDAIEPRVVVGGGDGGVLREITRHRSVERLDIAEIDGVVIETAKKYFPGMSLGAFYTLVPIRPRRRGERRSLRTFPVASLLPPLGFNPRPRRL